jgi:uncharacterized membrane protein (UPF0127 family)
MPVRHEPADGDPRVLATDVDHAEGLVSQVKGLMFREEVPEDYALVFDFDGAGYRSIHMLFVRVPLDVLWLRDDAVVQRKTLSPWTGLGLARADRVIELPAGAADGVAAGDAVVVSE